MATPIYLERIGSQDFNGIFSVIGRSTYERYCLLHREWIGQCLAEQSRLSGARFVLVCKYRFGHEAFSACSLG
jgi:hypothetical protein